MYMPDLALVYLITNSIGYLGSELLTVKFSSKRKLVLKYKYTSINMKRQEIADSAFSFTLK